MSSYVILTCDRAGMASMSCCDDSGNAPEAKTLALARRAAKQCGWILTGKDGAICPNCAQFISTEDEPQ